MMASTFPTSLDNFTNPTVSDYLNSTTVPHATQHADLNDAVEALEAKVGVDSSAVATSLDYKVAQLEAGATADAIVAYADLAARTAANPSPSEGDVSWQEDTNRFDIYNGSAWVEVSKGKILQVVRATDGTARNTTSTSFVDASISVTITPTSASSNILLVWSVACAAAGGQYNNCYLQITDNSNVEISGGQKRYGQTGNTNNQHGALVVAWDSPATTSATTYKGRFRAEASGSPTPTAYLENNAFGTGQLFAIEVSA